MTTANEIVDVVIVGAGFSGLYLLHRCRQLGLSARVWEAGAGVGGTWYWNRYPGARCDIESMQYSFEFDDGLQQEWNWSERYAPQPEILSYAEHVAERFELLSDIDFERPVTSACFDEKVNTWTLTCATGEVLTARYCIMATGCLSKPNWPKIEGYDAFKGTILHTALWPHESVELRGKRVAVIGTGSSGIQSIPRIAEVAEHMTVFQRTPNYSIPAQNRPLEPDEVADIKANYAQLRARAKTRSVGIEGRYNSGSVFEVSEAERQAEFERRWAEGGLTFTASFGDLMLSKEANDTLVAFVHGKIREIVEDPVIAAKLCPGNIIGGKRVCVDTDYYATYNRDNVELIDIRESPITAIVENGVQVGDTRHVADYIVVATGFDAMTGALNAIDIRGRGDQSLRDLWREGPRSYLGLAMAGFPNLFTVTGPGSPSVLSNMLLSIEQHVEWITDCIAYTTQQGHSTVEATESAEKDWWNHVQEAGQIGLKHSTDSWYLGANIEGKPRVFMPYLGGCPAYRKKCEEVVADGYAGFEFG
ncbi:MAG: NAD(P)/FAD-dependent oxidoreductase [Rhizobiaceae bacterium]